MKPRSNNGAASGRGSGADAVRGATARILIIDSGNVDHAQSLALLLQLDGYPQAAVVDDSESAFAVAVAVRPDVIITNLGSRGLPGCQFARRLRGTPELADTYLLALTGHASRQHRRLAREAGFDALVVKPYDFGLVKRLLAEAARGLGTAMEPMGVAGLP